MNGKPRAILVRDKLYISQKEYYRKIYAKGGDTPWDNAFEVTWLEKTLAALGSTKGKMALEIGTGYGKGARILKRAGWKTIGVDYVLEPLKVAVNFEKNKRRRPLYVQADIFEPPLCEHVFDLVLDWGVFHHIRRNETPQFIDAITRLLRPGGVFLLGCFSTKFRHSGEKRRKRNWTRHHGHYDRFSTKNELVKTFREAFEIGSIEEDPKGFFLLVMTARPR